MPPQPPPQPSGRRRAVQVAYDRAAREAIRGLSIRSVRVSESGVRSRIVQTTERLGCHPVSTKGPPIFSVHGEPMVSVADLASTLGFRDALRLRKTLMHRRVTNGHGRPTGGVFQADEFLFVPYDFLYPGKRRGRGRNAPTALVSVLYAECYLSERHGVRPRSTLIDGEAGQTVRDALAASKKGSAFPKQRKPNEQNEETIVVFTPVVRRKHEKTRG